MKVLYHNIKKYSKLDKFRKLILYFLVRNLSEEDIAHYHNYFDLFDSKNQGVITKDGFQNILSDHLNVDADSSGKVFENSDLFDNGKMSYTQLISAVIPYTKFFN